MYAHFQTPRVLRTSTVCERTHIWRKKTMAKKGGETHFWFLGVQAPGCEATSLPRRLATKGCIQEIPNGNQRTKPGE